MSLTRRGLLGAGGAALGLGITAPVLAPTASRPAVVGLPPRDLILLHSADAQGAAFAAALRGAATGCNIVSVALGVTSGGNYRAISTAVAAGRGKRLLAFVRELDDVLLNAALRGTGAVYYFQGRHGLGAAALRLHTSRRLPEITVEFAMATAGPAVLGALLGVAAAGLPAGDGFPKGVLDEAAWHGGAGLSLLADL